MTLEAHWVDIVPPVAPTPAADPLAVFLYLALPLALAGVAVLLYRRPRLRAGWMLRRLARDLRGARIGPKPACLRIRACLQRGLGRSALQHVQWQGHRQTQWRAFEERLSRYCFAAGVPQPAELEGLVREARTWLRRKTVAP